MRRATAGAAMVSLNAPTADAHVRYESMHPETIHDLADTAGPDWTQSMFAGSTADSGRGTTPHIWAAGLVPTDTDNRPVPAVLVPA